MASLDPNTQDQSQQAGLYAVESDTVLLKRALMNEKGAPDLLPYDTDLIARVFAAVAHQEQLIRDAAAEPEMALVRCLYASELDRMRYMLRVYLRTRLSKVERYVMHILDDEAEQEKLSEKEMQYAQEYFYAYGRHMKEAVLSSLPPAFNSLVKQFNSWDTRDMKPKPDLGRYVFCQCLEDRGMVELDDEGLETVDLAKGDLLVMRYKTIASLVREKWVQLI